MYIMPFLAVGRVRQRTQNKPSNEIIEGELNLSFFYALILHRLKETSTFAP